ncbi:TonB-dependent receptor, partial [Steroidobacter sp.]|uniref:TonB-dependent receptor n=1 Tax=Steroidobacter sp. TaxID=1978227 RepID=UPI001A632ED6
SVRGISQSDTSPQSEPPNGVYIDEIYVSSPGAAGFSLYDVSRIEVLRGPQGTLFGRNSTGGLAHFMTARPTSTWAGYVEAGFGSYSQRFFEGALGGPLSDRVRFRLSARGEEADGWWENRAPGGKDAFNKKFWGARGQLEADVTEDLTARVSISYDANPRTRQGTYKAQNFYIDANGQPAPLPATLDAYGTGPGNDLFGNRDSYGAGSVGAFNNSGFLENRRASTTLALQWKRGSTTFTSLTNLTNFSFDYGPEDLDGSPVPYVQAPLTQDMQQRSQELRATGVSGNLTWTTGLYYLHIDQDVSAGFTFPALSGSDFAYDAFNLIAQRTKSYAAFGQAEWVLGDQLRLTFGARYTEDEKRYDSKAYFRELGNGFEGGVGSTVFDPPLLAADFSTATVGNVANQKEGLWSGKLQLDYMPSDGKLLYAGISRGVKGAGFNTNLSATLPNEQTPFGSEVVTAYEVGTKFDLFDRRLRFNSSVFLYDYDDFQGYAYVGTQGLVANYDGTFYGAEVEAIASLPGDVRANLGASYIHTELKDVPTVYSGVREQRANLAPEWVVNGSLQKSVEVGSGTLKLQWSFDYLSDRYASVDNNAASLLKGSFQHDARIAYELGKRGLELAVFVKNISDENREVFVYDLITTGGYRMISYAPPRWWGASIRQNF